MGSSATELCDQERQILKNIFAHRFPPTPSIGSIPNNSNYSCLVQLESSKGCADIALPVFTLNSVPVAAGHPQNTPSRPIPLNPALLHQTIMQVLLKS